MKVTEFEIPEHDNYQMGSENRIDGTIVVTQKYFKSDELIVQIDSYFKPRYDMMQSKVPYKFVVTQKDD